ncbi:MAG: hypothetical protein NTZ34_14275, partial [Chloroflexi bacterium]|nr:hypothetical protein [Chloroflexota bacterium]
MALSAISKQFIRHTLWDIDDVGRTFKEARYKLHNRGQRQLLDTGFAICSVLKDSLKAELKTIR